jgi:tripartite-type tricarboxylate transporter receptor subunit TctC
MHRLIVAVALALAAIAAPVLGQSYPNKPIRILVPYPPGGVFDALLRPLARDVGEALGQPLVLDNRPGGNTIIAMDACAKAPPDGYTICATSNDSMSLNPHLYSKLPYDTERDLVGVSNLVFIDELIVAHASVPFTSFREMIDYARSKPGALNYGSFGLGSSAHMILAWINNRAGTDIVHVPYRGGGPAVAAVLANEVQVIYMGTGALLPHVRSGKLKALAVTQRQRSPFLPDVPTMGEQGMDFQLKPWIGIVAPAGTPAPIVQRLAAEMARVIRSAKFNEEVLARQSFEAIGSTPEQFAEFMKEDRALGATLVRISNLKLD